VPIPAAPQAAKSDAAQTDFPAPLAALTGSEPSPGVLCAGPGCWQRNTRKYGLRRLPLCDACAAALRGETCQRPIPPGAARVIRGTAA
jgi:hypothetical protein